MREASEIDKVRLGTRGSRLALAQAHSVKDQLSRLHPGLEVEIVTIRTSGDRGERDRLGAFVRDIQDDLLAGNVDVALHCLKDLPTEPVPGLTFAAYLEREDARDTLISRGPSLMELRAGAVVGTGSLRRTSQLASIRSDLVFRPLVGNVDTRLRKLIEGEYDAIVLAIAGLKRLGILGSESNGVFSLSSAGCESLSVRPLAPDEMLPAPGQAVLVLEVREEDSRTASFVSSFDHPVTRSCSDAERSFLRAFGGGCSVPVAASAVFEAEGLLLSGLVASPDGVTVHRGTEAGLLDDAVGVGARLASRLGEAGAFDVVRSVLAARDGVK